MEVHKQLPVPAAQLQCLHSVLAENGSETKKAWMDAVVLVFFLSFLIFLRRAETKTTNTNTNKIHLSGLVA